MYIVLNKNKKIFCRYNVICNVPRKIKKKLFSFRISLEKISGKASETLLLF